MRRIWVKWGEYKENEENKENEEDEEKEKDHDNLEWMKSSSIKNMDQWGSKEGKLLKFFLKFC